MAQYDLFEKRTSGYSIDVEAYLQRIDCVREYKPSLRFLRQMHKNHLLHIPFENLDIHIGNEIILDVSRIFNKLITSKRGGFCYELNGLFYHLLLELGFQAKIISARVVSEDGTLGKEFDHLLLIVYLEDNQYLVDVGFGSSFHTPKEFVQGKVQMDQNKYYRITELVDGNFMLQSSTDSMVFKDEYMFSKRQHQFVEFIAMCQYHQTSPRSHFTQKKIITQSTPDGRITLTDKKFIRTKMGKREETTILNDDEFLVKLWENFAIKLKKNK
ncbi:MAG: arylamine N-acetyltransferase [Cyclobacteriaceae bacterium]